ncbi:unnamed protein product [Bursaphelenchus xylophilus]|uniref:Transcription initiation factor IIE subunit beta n=1 Tax=Bursaphelenchus xylophilus TaxID=6326 RepID=A0A1I7SWC6_BURXY|nr:unnamed protein product [Bursaphelenchus xylophilus]CAG9099196.1 unnamed protein product [Bursaphelenchus xylophilus]
MNELLKQQEKFRQSAIRAIDTAPKASGSHSTYVPVENRATKRKRETKPKDDKQSNSVNFAVMARIVDYMKKRHLNGSQWGLSLQEILDEMAIFDLTKKTLTWLEGALPENTRLQVSTEGDTVKYIFKPPLKVKNSKTLLQLLKKYHQDAKGGLLLTLLNECIPDATKVVASLAPNVIDIPTQVNKRKDHAYYYNDTELDVNIDDEFVQLWRHFSVDHLDEKKIEEYLQKHGISTIKDLAPTRVTNIPKRKQAKRRTNTKVQNTHLDGLLEEYDNS